MAAAKEMGQTDEEGLALHLSLDHDGNGLVDYTEFSEAFEEEGIKSKVFTVKSFTAITPKAFILR